MQIQGFLWLYQEAYDCDIHLLFVYYAQPKRNTFTKMFHLKDLYVSIIYKLYQYA